MPRMDDSAAQPIVVVEHTRDPAPLAAVLRELRPQYATDAEISQTLRQIIRTQGLRVFGAHLGGDAVACGAVTVRRVESLSWGEFLYVDDLVTSELVRGRGVASRLMDRVDELATEAGLRGKVQLDSGVGVHRAAAHAFYGSRGMWIAGFHFIQRD